MAHDGKLRQQSIDRLTAPHIDKTADAAVALWEPVAKHIIAIVGVGGFDSLYARSVFLTQSQYPWLDATALSAPPDHRFTNLKNSLEGVTPELAYAANRLLLTIFTDTLASLIGEPLTTRILDSAWGHGAFHAKSKDPQK